MEAEAVVFKALSPRNETNGEMNFPGDETTLDGMTDAEKAWLVAKNYYSITNPEAVPDDLWVLIEDLRG